MTQIATTYLIDTIAEGALDVVATVVCCDDCETAAFLGHVACLRQPWDWTCARAAASTGRLDCLKYLHQRGCEWNHFVMAAAAHGGFIDCLEYCIDHGCAMDPFVTYCAAQARRVDVLHYLRSRGCPWNAETMRVCAYNDDLVSVRYLRRHNCPMPDDWSRDDDCPWNLMTRNTRNKCRMLHVTSRMYKCLFKDPVSF
jgi:hypothetical protein